MPTKIGYRPQFECHPYGEACKGEFAEAIEVLQDLGRRDLGDFFDFDITLVRGGQPTALGV